MFDRKLVYFVYARVNLLCFSDLSVNNKTRKNGFFSNFTSFALFRYVRNTATRYDAHLKTAHNLPFCVSLLYIYPVTQTMLKHGKKETIRRRRRRHKRGSAKRRPS